MEGQCGVTSEAGCALRPQTPPPHDATLSTPGPLLNLLKGCTTQQLFRNNFTAAIYLLGILSICTGLPLWGDEVRAMAPTTRASVAQLLLPLTTRNLHRKDELCDICTSFDGLEGFGHITKCIEIPLPDMRKNHSCPLCLWMIASTRYLRRNSKGKHERFAPSLKFQTAVVVSPNEYQGFVDDWYITVGNRNISNRETNSADFDILGYPAVSLGKQRRIVPRQCDFSSIRDWIRTCDTAHDHPPDPVERGSLSERLSELLIQGVFRLIDVSSCTVVVTREPARYLALSYVWGQVMDSTASRNYAASTGAIQEHCSFSQSEAARLDFDGLPKTIREAIELCSRLGERYLWVDALCIDQSNASEKSTVISAMSVVYKCAALTIVAASGNDAEAGLPGVSLTDRPQDTVQALATGDGNSVNLLRRRFNLDHTLENSLWSSRGWTYQEQMLSPRCLYFTEEEIFFTCTTHQYREAYKYQTPEIGHDLKAGRKAFKALDHNFKMTAWQQRITAGIRMDYYDYVILVEQYTARNLTYDGDRLAAFLGFTPQLTEIASEQDVCLVKSGIPLQYLGATLHWYTPYDTVCRRVSQSPTDQSCAPSWSWAGWTGRAIISVNDNGCRDDAVAFALNNNNKALVGRLTDFGCYLSQITSAAAPPMFGDCDPDPDERFMTLHLWTTTVETYLPSCCDVVGFMVYLDEIPTVASQWNVKFELAMVGAHVKVWGATHTVHALAIKRRAEGYVERVGVVYMDHVTWQNMKPKLEYFKLR